MPLRPRAAQEMESQRRTTCCTEHRELPSAVYAQMPQMVRSDAKQKERCKTKKAAS